MPPTPLNPESHTLSALTERFDCVVRLSGHFALVTALLDKLKKQPFPSRIIVLTSSVHSQAK